MEGRKLHQSVAFLHHSDKATVFGIGLLFGSLYFRRCLKGLGLAQTEYGIADDLLVRTRNGVVSVVLTVNLTGHRRGGAECGNLFKVKERTGAVREEGVTGVGVGTRTHVRKDLNAEQFVERLVETDTVCGKSHAQPLLIQRVLQSELEQGRIFVLALKFGLEVVFVQILVGVVGAVGLDVLLDLCHFIGGRLGVQHVNRHLFGDRECLDGLCLGGFTRHGAQVLEGVVSRHFPVSKVVLCGVAVLIVGEGFFHHVKDLGLKVVLFNLLRNQHLALFTTDGVFHTQTVFDVLDDKLAGLDLILRQRLAVGGINALSNRPFSAVIGVFVAKGDILVLDDNLGEKLKLDGCGRALGSTDIVGVGEQDLSRLGAAHGNFSAVCVHIQLVTFLYQAEVHRCQLILRFSDLLGSGVIARILGIGTAAHVIHGGGCAGRIILRSKGRFAFLCSDQQRQCAHKHQNS